MRRERFTGMAQRPGKGGEEFIPGDVSGGYTGDIADNEVPAINGDISAPTGPTSVAFKGSSNCSRIRQPF